MHFRGKDPYLQELLVFRLGLGLLDGQVDNQPEYRAFLQSIRLSCGGAFSPLGVGGPAHMVV